MSLSDGTKKMSKSSQSQYSNISIIGILFKSTSKIDTPEHIQECIKRAKTDCIQGLSYYLQYLHNIELIKKNDQRFIIF